MRRGAAAFLAVASMALLATPAAQARTSDVVDAHVSIRLADDASLLVEERLTFDYDGSFEASYRDVELRHGERLTEIRVSEDDKRYRPGGSTAFGSIDTEGTFGATPTGTGGRIVWHHKASNEKRTFTLSYRVIDGAVAYDDVIDVFWAVWGDQWKFDLKSLSADFKSKALDPADPDFRVWGHPRTVEGKTERRSGEATLVASDVQDGTAVEFRITVPRRPGQGVTGARRMPGDGLEKILKEEKELDEDFNSPFQKAKRWVAHNALALALALAGLSILFVALLRWRTREYPVSTPEYLPEPPDDASPALAYGLAHEGADSTNTVLATLLDLVDRGYYETKQTTTEKEKLDLALSKADKRPPVDKLEPHEKEVLSFFDELVQTASVPMSLMRNNIPKHSATWRARWQDMTGALDSIDEGKLDWDRDLRPWHWLMIPVVLGLFVLISIAQVNVEEQFPVAAPIGLLTMLILPFLGGRALRRLAPRYRERSSQWQAFERWTDDFPRLKDDPPATLDLWKKILIYGVAFGTADRMIESGRIPEPVIQESSGTWSHYAFTNQLSSSSLHGSAFSSGFASQVAPQSSSSGGGGGFSGGGGGGASGGGGGGSW